MLFIEADHILESEKIIAIVGALTLAILHQWLSRLYPLLPGPESKCTQKSSAHLQFTN